MPPEGEVREQRFTFDEVAALYDRARARYPESLIDDVFTLSGVRPGGRILEIGCGTGQATVSFARRGVSMICLEPGRNLARLAQERLAEFNVEIVNQTFEDWPGEPQAFDLVLSAQSWHWVTPEVRFVKAGHVLRPGGALAIFSREPVILSAALRERVDAAYAQHAPTPSIFPAEWYGENGPLRELFAASRCFGPVTYRSYSWAHRFRAGEYVDLLRTHSGNRILPPEQREALFAAVHAAIESQGGEMDVRYEAHLHVAHRLS